MRDDLRELVMEECNWRDDQAALYHWRADCSRRLGAWYQCACDQEQAKSFAANARFLRMLLLGYSEQAAMADCFPDQPPGYARYLR